MGKISVADLSPSRTAERPNFTDRIRREIIMEQESPLSGKFDGFYQLLVAWRAKSGDG